MLKPILTMKLFDEKYGVCRLDSNADIPIWSTSCEFFSITKTDDELSVVCEETKIPDNIIAERNWRIIKILGPLDFSLVGILSKISKALADNNISIFAISTYDTDYILVKNNDIDNAIKVLKRANYSIIK